VTSETSPGRGIARTYQARIGDGVVGERNGRVPTKPRASSRMPATYGYASSQWPPRVTSAAEYWESASPASSSPPGGPISRRLWLPAQATSSARFEAICPRTSRKSAGIGGVGEHLRGVDGNRVKRFRGVDHVAACGKDFTPKTLTLRPRPPRAHSPPHHDVRDSTLAGRQRC